MIDYADSQSTSEQLARARAAARDRKRNQRARESSQDDLFADDPDASHGVTSSVTSSVTSNRDASSASLKARQGKAVVDVTEQTANLRARAQANGAAPFDEFWRLYPRKVCKRAAMKAVRRAVTVAQAGRSIAGA